MYVFNKRKGDEKTDIESKNFLKINCAGVAVGSYERFHGDCRIFRPEGRNDWQIQLVTEGVIDLYDGDTHYSLKPGDCFIIPPGVTNDYIYRINGKKRQTVGYYVHFSGTAAKELMDSLGVRGIAVFRNVPGDVSRMFESLFYSRRTGRKIASLGTLLRIVSALSDEAKFLPTETEKIVRREADYINKHYTEDIDFDVMAKRCNLSRSRFTHVFSDIFGLPPTQYQQNLRIEQASELLRFSKLMVAEIAQRCGFKNQLYFSRVFKKVMGVSPTEFRETDNF